MRSGGVATAAGVRLAQSVEPGPELLVVDRDLAVEDQRAGRGLGHRRRQAAEPPRVVDAVAAHEADTVAVLVGDECATSRPSPRTPSPAGGTARGRAAEPEGPRITTPP